ncbi:hypothetical protein HOY82DRAFT_610682 [Tuber indicum]|nr:hypothetical protein HOY82DRAFT_610682 [Tuber indicum]
MEAGWYQRVRDQGADLQRRHTDQEADLQRWHEKGSKTLYKEMERLSVEITWLTSVALGWETEKMKMAENFNLRGALERIAFHGRMLKKMKCHHQLGVQPALDELAKIKRFQTHLAAEVETRYLVKKDAACSTAGVYHQVSRLAHGNSGMITIFEEDHTPNEGAALATFLGVQLDSYIVTPLTCIHPRCAYFTEVIVEAYLYEIQGTEPATYHPDFCHVRANMIEIHGASSPHITCDHLYHTRLANTIPKILHTPVECLQPLDLATQDLLSCRTGTSEAEDHSQLVTPTAAREVIMNVDAASHALEKEVPRICNYSNHVATASIPLLAKLLMLRASYLTIMLRAAGSVEPRLEKDSELVTGLAYTV